MQANKTKYLDEENKKQPTKKSGQYWIYFENIFKNKTFFS